MKPLLAIALVTAALTIGTEKPASAAMLLHRPSTRVEQTLVSFSK